MKNKLMVLLLSGFMSMCASQPSVAENPSKESGTLIEITKQCNPQVEVIQYFAASISTDVYVASELSVKTSEASDLFCSTIACDELSNVLTIYGSPGKNCCGNLRYDELTNTITADVSAGTNIHNLQKFEPTEFNRQDYSVKIYWKTHKYPPHRFVNLNRC